MLQKSLKIIGGLGVILALFYGYQLFDEKDTINLRQDTIIRELSEENKRLQEKAKYNQIRAEVAENSMLFHEKVADSLKSELSKKDLPIEKVVGLQGERADNLEIALEKCKEAKTIYVNTVGLKEVVIDNQKQIITLESEVINALKLQHRKEKRKKFLQGMGAGGLLVGILIILAI